MELQLHLSSLSVQLGVLVGPGATGGSTRQRTGVSMCTGRIHKLSEFIWFVLRVNEEKRVLI